MSSGAAQLPRQRGAHVVTAERSSVAERRRRCNPSEVWPPSRRRRRRGRRGCPDAGHAVRRSLRRADVRPPGRVDVRCPGDRCPRDRCDPGVRCPWPLCPRCPDRAGSRTSVPRDRPRWRTGFDVSRWSQAAWSSPPESGLAGDGWSNVGSAWLGTNVDGRPGPPLRSRTGCGAALAAWPTKRAGPAPGCRSVGSGAREGAGAHKSPAGASWAGCRRDARHGAGPEGSDHARWSLSWCWSRVVRLWRARPVQRGVDCGRAAAAACEARCPLGADSTLTS
jgi:hypothetical protein